MKRRGAREVPGWALCKGAILASAAVLGCMGVWTVLLLWQVVPLTTIPVVNSVLKFLGAGLSALLSARACNRRPALYGGLAGLLFWLMSFCSMSLFSGEWTFSPAILGDMAVTAAVGMAVSVALSLLHSEPNRQRA